VLEPCGCTRDQLGGIDRLATAATEARSEGIPTLFVSAGDLFFGRDDAAADPPVQDLWRAQALAEILRGLGLNAAGMGPHDLAHSRALLASFAHSGGFSWVSSGLLLDRGAGQNLATAAAVADAPLEPVKSSALVTVGNLHVGIAGLLARPKPTWPRGVRGPDDPLAATLNEIKKLRAQRADLVIALAEANASGVAALAQPGNADFIVASGNDFAPGVSPSASAWVLNARRAGQALLVADLWLRAPGAAFRVTGSSAVTAGNELAVREELFPSSAAQAPAARKILDGLTQRVSAYNQQAYRDALPPRVQREQAGYVGSRPCAACHTAEYLWWSESPHAHAYASLVQRNEQFDLNCVRCHVTGYAKPGGSTVTHVDQLASVGCESCHGPGSTHIVDARPPHRFIRRVVPAAVCTPCHDAEHSHGFEYDSYSAALKARGHGLPLGQ
jgi:hypothetical protein